jgi:parvulin-like peptidyl-prolyl isomerase
MPNISPRFMLSAALLLNACSSATEPTPVAETPLRVSPTPASPVSALSALAPAVNAKPATDADLKAAALQTEACGQIIVVSFKSALQAAESITRSKAVAIARAGELLEQVKAGADFAAVARKESDAPTSAARGGIMGTFYKHEWPKLHEAIKDTLFALDVGQLAPAPVEAEYGITVVKRCPVEKAHSRHLLVRYKGAKKADGDVKRTKEQAKAFAEACLARLVKGEDFAKVATDCSDDASKERGGDIGLVGRGLFAPPFEAALFAMKPGERSPVVETDFGFHVIERLPD